ncbi:MAG: hypothetical protein ACRC46_08400 [Thermoguttaceae bacterium]
MTRLAYLLLVAFVVEVACGADVSPDVVDAIPLLSLDEIRRADDAETVRRAVTWTEHDTKPFYTLLAHVASLPRGELAERAAEDSVSVRDLFLKPEQLRLRAVALDGIVKRVVETPTSETGRARWGIDRYYQLYLFPRESDGNPVVVCVTKLPAGMSTGDAVSDDVHVTGLYYKLWMYESRAGRVQVAPVIVSNDVTLFAPPVISGREQNLNTSLVLFSILVAVWIVVRVWRWSTTSRHSPLTQSAYNRRS